MRSAGVTRTLAVAREWYPAWPQWKSREELKIATFRTADVMKTGWRWLFCMEMMAGTATQKELYLVNLVYSEWLEVLILSFLAIAVTTRTAMRPQKAISAHTARTNEEDTIFRDARLHPYATGEARRAA